MDLVCVCGPAQHMRGASVRPLCSEQKVLDRPDGGCHGRGRVLHGEVQVVVENSSLPLSHGELRELLSHGDGIRQIRLMSTDGGLDDYACRYRACTAPRRQPDRSLFMHATLSHDFGDVTAWPLSRTFQRAAKAS